MLLCGILSGTRARALDPHRAITQYIENSWNSESGLPQNSVHAVAQTANGYVWLGTEEGLTRFDGVAFKTYNHGDFPGLPSDFIQALEAGKDGVLWVGTDSGLAMVRPRADGGASDNPKTIARIDALTGKNVTALRMDAGVLWVGTTQGLFRIENGEVRTWLRPESLDKVEVHALARDGSGTIWAATASGLFAIRGGEIEARWTAQNGLPNDSVASVAAARDGSIWAGFPVGGLVKIADGHLIKPDVKLPAKTVLGLLSDRDGNLWMALDRQGIGRLSNGRLELQDTAHGFPSERCTKAIFEDREGDLWFGLVDGGVAQLRDDKLAVFGKPEGLSGDYIGNVLEAKDGTMWFGADSNGLNHLLPDGHVEIWNQSKGLPADAVYSLLQTRDGAMWVGYRSGELARIFDGKVKLYSDPTVKEVSLNALFEDRDGRMWVGYWGKGLAELASGQFRHVDGATRVSQITQSPDGAMWVATDGNGVERYRNGQMTRFYTKNGLPSNHALALYADPDGDLWVGAGSGGLSRIRGDQVVSWTRYQGLRQTTIGSIVEDNLGYLWFGTDDGIFQISKADLNRSAGDPRMKVDPQMYGLSDGLRTRETLYGSSPCVWKGRDGRLWFATIHGAAVVNPADMRMDSILPKAWIERVLFDSHAVDFTNGIQLGPGSGNLEISFAAPSFYAGQQVSYRYRLVGFDSAWVDAGRRRTAWYTNLPAGRYRFEVMAENSDELWSKSGSSLEFSVAPPLTGTPLAYGLYVIVVVLAGWGFVALRTRVLVRRQYELARMVEERTQQLEKEKAALEAARRELQIQATHDSLTGIANRGAILEHLERELSRAVRDRSPLGVVLIDLDHFKNVNDEHGHLCGDAVLKESAARLRASLRGYDMVGRYGGEEFLLLFPGWEAATGAGRIEDLLHTISGRALQTKEAEILLTCSIGVANFLPERDAHDATEILRRADAELYAAKNAGRNRASFEMRASVRSKKLTVMEAPASDGSKDVRRG
ncbi:two-component regulator propeller domain-containing protein [Acidicapsa dinghuensis]|uniref:diguanylate cyclase n=1 Tax=Acidicapsa dinghuensis TaxID=2218256 RepID=A0ABW1E8W7_9BACT|nr:two-component regulator propeller domain-containing protein [Acidicapsa dinghuensis]